MGGSWGSGSSKTYNLLGQRFWLLGWCRGLRSTLLFATVHAHLSHEIHFLSAELLLTILGCQFHILLINNDLSDSLVALTREFIGSYLLLVDLAPLDDCIEAAAHIVELKMRARRGACVFVVRVIVEVNSFVVHQAASAISGVCVIYHSFLS
jgi:hypothetical protein